MPALLLVRLLPPGLRRAVRAARRLVADADVARRSSRNSGTEAVEGALKLARHHTGRPNVIAFFGAFHGRSLGVAVAHVVEGASTAAGSASSRPAATTLRLAVRRRAERRRVHRRGAVPAHDRAGRRRRDLRRADPGRGRLHRAARRLAGSDPRRSATGTASCSSSTRCSRASAAPGRCGPASTTASCPTSSRAGKGLASGLPARRHHRPRRDHGLGARASTARRSAATRSPARPRSPRSTSSRAG